MIFFLCVSMYENKKVRKMCVYTYVCIFSNFHSKIKYITLISPHLLLYTNKTPYQDSQGWLSTKKPGSGEEDAIDALPL